MVFGEPKDTEGTCMRKLGQLLLASALMIPILGTGCAEHRQVYAWGPGETTYYVRWERETHRDHVDWEQRNDADHNAYWNWRKHRHD
jgi:hypothetical protein